MRPWLRLLWEHGPSLDWALYFPRILFLTGLATANSCLATVEAVLYGGCWEQQQLHPEPVFILGHPRTGTTHLHNLLSLDGRFAFATTFQAGRCCPDVDGAAGSDCGVVSMSYECNHKTFFGFFLFFSVWCTLAQRAGGDLAWK